MKAEAVTVAIGGAFDGIGTVLARVTRITDATSKPALTVIAAIFGTILSLGAVRAVEPWPTLT
jgi:ABC-type cobalamin transport system permease subunit